MFDEIGDGFDVKVGDQNIFVGHILTSAAGNKDN